MLPSAPWSLFLLVRVPPALYPLSSSPHHFLLSSAGHPDALPSKCHPQGTAEAVSWVLCIGNPKARPRGGYSKVFESITVATISWRPPTVPVSSSIKPLDKDDPCWEKLGTLPKAKHGGDTAARIQTLFFYSLYTKGTHSDHLTFPQTYPSVSPGGLCDIFTWFPFPIQLSPQMSPPQSYFPA